MRLLRRVLVSAAVTAASQGIALWLCCFCCARRTTRCASWWTPQRHAGIQHSEWWLLFLIFALQNDTLRKLVDAEAAERQRLQQLSAALEAQVGAGESVSC